MIFRFNGLAAAALAAAAFLSCTMEEPGEELVLEMTQLSLTSQKPVYDGEQSGTKTHWNGSTVLWSSGDRIRVCVTEDGIWHGEMYESEALSEDAPKVSFDFSVPSSLTGSLHFYTVFPSSATSGFDDGDKVKVTLPAVQTPSASSFDPGADLMVGESVEKYSGIPVGDVPVMWERLAAHADITLSNLPFDASETVKSVNLKAQEGAALAGDFLVDMMTRTVEPSGNMSDEILVNAAELDVSGAELRVWLAFMPLTVTSLELTVTTDRAVYVRSIPTCSLTFRRNARSYMTIDMSSAREDMSPAEEQALDATVNARLFDMLNLDYPGLENVASLYADGRMYKAASALLDYWRNGRTVVNPDVDLSNTSYMASEKEHADKALKENGYCFYVSNYDYHSFADGKGGIDWGFTLQNETQFALQKHRHQWVLPQAKVYWGTKDEKYIKSFIEVYSSWLAAHPCPVLTSGSYGIALSHPLRDVWTDLQATSRVMDQINVLDYYISSENMTPGFLSHFLTAFADAVECIRANPYYDAMSNHRLYEIQAVYSAAVMMPEFKNAGTWLQEASADVATQLDLQFAEDGVLVEMDPGYHIPMVAIFYDTHRIVAANGMLSSFPSDYKEKLSKAVRFVRDLCYPDYSIEDFNDVRSVSWTRSVLTKNFVKYYDMFPDDPTLQYWATGHAEGTAPEETLSLYPTTGWYMLRNGWTEESSMMILKNNYNKKDNGEVWWHCQPDNGTVALYHKGRRFLPDAGSYTYTEGEERNAYRATSMHNTLTLNGATISNSNMLGACKNSAQTEVYDMVHTSNQSYGALRHERAVFRVKDGFYVVVDYAIGSATGSVELNWHFCPGDVAQSSDTMSYSCMTDFADENNMLFRTFCFSGTTASSAFTGTSGTSYTSDTIGTSQERSCCRIAMQKTDPQTPVRFITVIYPFAQASQIPEISAIFNSASKMTVTIAGKDYVLSL